MNSVLMRILNLTQRTRRILAASILAAVVLTCLGLAVQLVALLRAELSELTAQRERIGQQELTLRTMRAAIESNKNIGASLQNTFLQGDSEAVAEASLQSWLGEAAQNAGVDMNSISGAQPVDDGALRMIGVRTSVTGTYDRIVQLLAMIEASTPRLTVVKGELLSSADDMFEEGQAELRITANLTVMGISGPEAKGTEQTP